MIDKEGRIKPCGGAIPTRAIRDYAIPLELLTARIKAARIISPKGEKVRMDIGDRGYVGMVDRDVFDPWLRERAEKAGAKRMTAQFNTLAYRDDGAVMLTVTP